ncbi:4'-phosphopantetheinyl transferase family protein [Neisseria bacilliformis]|uniref:4'-phosphopantetheinyl transferase family protein n=1 Tax=Neisseria bacilliformis TaxID=267212 RepID=UPI0006656764|nr:4'-phosphopantetheinyl transferase superfamily protein [Neisseria bacilliformis]
MNPAPTVLHCLLGAPDLSAAYRRAGLDADDLCRVRRVPVLEKRADWRVSRALKRQAGAPVLSLSHSGGFAALLCTDAPVRAGVDLERLKMRDFQALAQWVCTGEEREFLRRRRWRAADFYRLWCFKEALLKAADLSFPADIASVGYCFNSGLPTGLHAVGQRGWHGTSALLPQGYALSCVWFGGGISLETSFYGSWDNAVLQHIEAV